MTTYRLRDLVLALRDAREWQEAVPVLAEYSQARYSAMAAAFGLSAAEAPGLEYLRVNHDDLPASFFERAMEKLATLEADPFTGFLVMPPEHMAVYWRHHDALRAGYAAAREAVVGLAVDILTARWGLARDASVDDAALEAHGFDPTTPAPDPNHYW